MKQLIDLSRQLVAINSINPTLSAGPGEVAIAEWILQWLQSAGIECQLQEAAPGRPNVIARVAGHGTAPPLVLNAHLDTVGVEGMRDPFTLRVEGDRLYGRGSQDMKGSVAVMLVLAERLLASTPPGDVWFTFVSDEEDLSVGTEALVRDWLPLLSEAPAAAIVLEPSGEEIGIAHKGFVWYELSVGGRAAHGSRPAEGIDAILPLGAALNELARLEETFASGEKDALLGRRSLHACTVEGGTEWSVYPATAMLRWERRILPGESPAVVDAEMEQVVRVAREVNEAQVEGRSVFRREPLGTSSDAAVVQAFRQVVPSAPLVGLSYWTDGALFSEAGVPTVIYGPEGEGLHTIEEWVSAASLERLSNTLQQVIERAASWAG